MARCCRAAIGRGKMGVMGWAPVMPDQLLTHHGAGNRPQLQERPHKRCELGCGAAFWETYLDDWQKSITEEGASMTKRSHGIYSDRMINFSLLIQNGNIWGEFREMFDSFKHWLFGEELLHKSNTFYHLTFELLQRELSNLLLEVLQNQCYQDLTVQCQEPNP